MRIDVDPGQVFVRHGDDLKEVAAFEIAGTLRAKKWVVPIEPASGHVLLNEDDEPAHQELNTQGVEWKRLMESEPGVEMTPEAYRQMNQQSQAIIDLANVKPFIRLSVETKPNDK